MKPNPLPQLKLKENWVQVQELSQTWTENPHQLFRKEYMCCMNIAYV